MLNYFKMYKFCFLIMMISCVSPCNILVYDEFENYEPIPVMNALLQADSTFCVQLSMSANLTDSAPTFISNAQVIIESTDNTPDTLIYAEKGWYVSSRIVKAGATYTCQANIPGYAALSAQTTVPMPTVIDSVLFTDLALRGEEGEKISSVEFRIQNNLQAPKFWRLELIIKGVGMHYDYETEEFIESYYENDGDFFIKPEQDSVFLYEPNPLSIFSNNKMKKNTHWIKFYINENYNSFNSGKDTFMIVLNSIDESLYKYQKQYYIYQSSGSPAIGSSQQNYNLYSNIKNGLGIFTGTSTTKKDVPLFQETK